MMKIPLRDGFAGSSARIPNLVIDDPVDSRRLCPAMWESAVVLPLGL